ncbi:hypothetical protein [Marinitenerispora sediminis]|uniref:Uncharacterized protein n=1 Tax=Marinitenerispora sediminis TaxID=1931232 RepID=A0A368TAF2_9ACTN|nr:hypothetical protein [Marinitenerispora sediminis]RCV52864.1 hypothetical protein DEF28_11960 [Marinitenerispora sediminis]RCV60040.1 hypothetical protein DEF23_05755 [Marinitenerispora sediminis]RCV61947.1 hypothetical protein DEF24_03060 [Marinitenerispora sediminis]
MTAQRRKIITVVGLLLAAVIVLLDSDLAQRGSFDPAEIIGMLVSVLCFALLISVACRGLHARRGTAAMFVFGWGALALAALAGHVGDAVARVEFQLYPDFGAVAADSPAGDAAEGTDPGTVAAATAVRTCPDPAFLDDDGCADTADPGYLTVLPTGTGAVALAFGWLPALGMAGAYARTRPEEDPHRANPSDGPT